MDDCAVDEARPQGAQRTSGEVSMSFWTVVNFSSADEIMKIAKKTCRDSLDPGESQR